MNFNYQAGTSPLQARSNFPVIPMIIIILIVILVLFLIWFIAKKIKDYYASDKYIEKETNRITRRNDVVKFCKEHELSQHDFNILWNVCRITNCKNILYSFKSNTQVLETFRAAYNQMINFGMTDQKINDFFVLQYKIETIVAKLKGIKSTHSIAVDKIVFYITDMGEQLPLFVYKNERDAFFLELPEFLYKSPRRPKLLVRQRFTYKTENGLSYNFITRIIRYNEDTSANKFLMVVSHTEQLECTSQRNSKREYIEVDVGFCPVKKEKDDPRKKSDYIYSTKVYNGKLTNFSAGGCCIQTELPILENQCMCLILKNLGVTEKVIGIIRRTRRLQNGKYALHIQFIDISIKTTNKLYTLIYKYEI